MNGIGKEFNTVVFFEYKFTTQGFEENKLEEYILA